MFWGVISAVLIGGWGVVYICVFHTYRGFVCMKVPGIKLQKLAPPMLYLIEKSSVTQRLPLLFYKIQQSLQRTGLHFQGTAHTLLFLAEMLSYSYLLLVLGCVLSSVMDGDNTGFIIGVILALLLPIALLKDLLGKVKKREQQIILELPELLNKIILLVGAGATVQQAIRHCLDRKDTGDVHPLYRELIQMQREWESGYSFQQAMESFSKRCGIQEVSAFTTAVLLNFRRGGNDFALALRELSHTLWEKRKNVSKTLGEQASAKLVFPMAVLFMIIIVLVGYPAFMLMDL